MAWVYPVTQDAAHKEFFWSITIGSVHYSIQTPQIMKNPNILVYISFLQKIGMFLLIPILLNDSKWHPGGIHFVNFDGDFSAPDLHPK